MLEKWWVQGMETADCLKVHTWLWSVERRCFVHSGMKLYRIAEEKRSEFMMKTDAMGAEGPCWQQRSKMAAIKDETMLRAQ